MNEWRTIVQQQAGTEDDPAKPNWIRTQGVIGPEIPICNTSCAHHDGKRCRLMGVRVPYHCEPVIAQMAIMLSEGPRR